MPIIDGTPVDAATTNPEFIDARVDDQAQGKIDFVNIEAVSGPSVINIQREINSLNSFTGRTSGSAFDATPTYSNDQGFTPNNNVFERADEISAKFNNVTGHAHSGAAGDGAPINSSSIANVPLRGYFELGVTLLGVLGSSSDVSLDFTGQTPSVIQTVPGVVVSAPFNKLILRQGSGPNEDDQIVDEFGNTIYGRLTESSGVWTISYYVMIAGTETPYSFLIAQDIKYYYQKLYNPLLNPPVYSEIAIVPSENATADVVQADVGLQGKVSLANTVQPIAGTGSAGTPNAVVANADHTHEGVHAIKIDGDPTLGLGDVTFTNGDGISLTWDAGKLKITGLGAVAKQEIPAGIVDGINTVFGPLSFMPSDANSVLVFIDYIAVPITTGFTVSGSTITFQPGWEPQPGQTVYAFYLTAGTPSVPVMSGAFRVEYRTVSLAEETAKSLTLSFTPATSSYTMLDIIGGGAQFFGTDFTVSGSTLSWSGLGLDGLLTAGDRLRISYVT